MILDGKAGAAFAELSKPRPHRGRRRVECEGAVHDDVSRRDDVAGLRGVALVVGGADVLPWRTPRRAVKSGDPLLGRALFPGGQAPGPVTARPDADRRMS